MYLHYTIRILTQIKSEMFLHTFTFTNAILPMIVGRILELSRAFSHDHLTYELKMLTWFCFLVPQIRIDFLKKN